MNDEKYVWVVDLDDWGHRIKIFDNEPAARKYSQDHASSFSGFEGNYALSVRKIKVES